ncbi:MAG TPA: hypothetical protein VLA16_11800 [Ideonella sp.]|nr:hypothetical protein [Ideonella sp.]
MNTVVEPRATLSQQEPGLAMHWDYEAGTPWGPVRLALHAASADGPPCAAQAALRLQASAAWLDVVDAWLAGGGSRAGGQGGAPAPPMDGLDWVWRPRTTAPVEPGAVWVCAAGPLGEGGRLALPWSLLRQLPAPPLSALGLGLAWEPVAAECLLATLDLSEAEEAALEPGGLLLLPASFSSEWRAGLRAPGETAAAGRPVAWRHGGGVRPTEGPPAMVPPGAWQVCAPLAHAVDPGIVLGWWGGEGCLGLAPAATLTRCDGAAGRGWALAQGRLTPWGQGLGLLVEALAPRPARGD